jgi:SAM-dependent methyltransferase
MVGVRGDQGCGVAAVTPDDVSRGGYAQAGEAWAEDAMLAYGPMARHLVERCPIAIDGSLALDAGAGTGAAGAALVERGARVIAADLEIDMLKQNRSATQAAVADVTALPFRLATFDVCVGAFVLNHLLDPVRALVGFGAVTRPRGAVLASVFATTRHPAKKAVEDTASRFGWREPEWYALLKSRATTVGTVDRMIEAAREARLGDIDVVEDEFDIGLDDPTLVVRHRLGLPQFTQFIGELSSPQREHLLAEAAAAVGAISDSFRPAVIELIARVNDQT